MKVKALKDYELINVKKDNEYNVISYYDEESEQFIYYINNEYIGETEFYNIFKIVNS